MQNLVGDYKQTDKVFKEHAQVFHNIEEFFEYCEIGVATLRKVCIFPM